MLEDYEKLRQEQLRFLEEYYASCDLEIRDPLKIDIKCQYVDSLYRKLERLLKEVE